MGSCHCNADESYTQEVFNAGAWIDKDFLENVLTTELKNEAEVVDFEIKPAVGAGENYLSVLHKVLVNFKIQDTKQNLHLIIKGPPTSQIMLHVIEDMGVFHKEITMYSKCLPLMKSAIQENFPPNISHIAPNSYACIRPKTIIVEDLTLKGYKMADRQEQLDFNHCCVSLRTLARFHALSIKLYQENPELISSVAKESVVEANRDTHGKFVEQCFNAIISEIECREELSKFTDTFRDAAKCIWDKLIAAVKPTKHLNVLTHGDFWTNNILFKYDCDGSIDDAKLIDFQLVRYGSPVLDLIYFFFTSVKPDILEKKWNDLIEIYHKSLIDDMKCLKLEMKYSREELIEDMRDRIIYVLLILTQIFPIVIAPPSERFDASKEENSLAKNYKNSRYLQILCRYLTHLKNMGFLNDLKIRTNAEPIADSISK